jgi:hypothetical protein
MLLKAVEICEIGLDAINYNPLWFQYLRLYEKVDEKTRTTKFEKLSVIIKDIYNNIGKEYFWKIHVELAQLFDRLGEDQKTVEYLKSSLQECPESIKWKIWLVSSRIMVN